MTMQGRWRIEFFKTAAGRCPVQEYVYNLPGRESTRVLRALSLLESAGLELGAPHVRPLGEKLWELRVKGSIQHRLLYFAAPGRRIILLHGFTKKTRRTPSTEIVVARARMGECLRRT